MRCVFVAGQSSLVARRAHNPEVEWFKSLPRNQKMAAQLSWLQRPVHTRQVVGSSPTAATTTVLSTVVFLRGSLVQRSRTSPFHGGNTGSSPVGVTIPLGSIAQLGEHLPYKQGVTSSSLVVPTIKNCAESRKNSADIVRTLFLLLKACCSNQNTISFLKMVFYDAI